MPFPFIAAVAAAITVKTVLAGAAVAGAAYAGKKIYDASQEDSGSSSSTSGPSAEERRKEERQNIFRQARENRTRFYITHEEILCVQKHDLQTCQEIAENIKIGNLSVKEAEAKLAGLVKDKTTTLEGFGGLDGIENIISNPPKSVDDIVTIHKNNSFTPYWVTVGCVIVRPDYELIFSEANIEKLIPLCETSIATTAIPKKLSKIAKFYPPLSQLCAAAKARIEALNGNPRIVVCGMLKAGKSSLLNNLMGSLDDALFPVDIVRATTENKERIHEGICYVDTPGLEAKQEDTKEAKKAYISADMLLFVHSAESELIQQEIQWLHNLQKMHEGLEQRVLLVLTHIDSAGDNLDRLKTKINEQIKRALGFTLPMHAIDNMAYKKSFMPGKEALRQESGIEQFRMTIEHMRTTTLANAATEQKEKIQQMLVGIQEWVQNFADMTKALRKNQERSHKQLVDNFYRDVIVPAKTALKSLKS